MDTEPAPMDREKERPSEAAELLAYVLLRWRQYQLEPDGSAQEAVAADLDDLAAAGLARLESVHGPLAGWPSFAGDRP